MSMSSDPNPIKGRGEEFISEIKEYLEKKLLVEVILSQRPANEVIIDDADLQNILKVSKRQTAYLRESGLINYDQPIPKGKIYYTLQDAIDFIKIGTKPSIRKQKRF